MTESLWEQIVQSIKSTTRLSKLVTGVVVAVLVLGALLYWADISAVVNQVRTANPRLVMVAILMTAIIIISRTIVSAVLYRAIIDNPIDRKFYAGYPVVGLFRAMLPGGYITGSLVAAYVLGRSLDKRAKPLLVALTVAEVVHTVASVVFFFAGLVFLPRFALSSLSQMPEILVPSILIVTLFGVLLLRSREYVQSFFRKVINYWIGKSQLFEQYIQLEHLDGERIRDPFSVLSSRLHHARRALLVGGVFAMIAQAAVVMALFIGVHAVGGSISMFAAVVILLPSRLGGLGFLPGGLGGVESALTALLIVFTDLSRDGATAGTLLYRATTFWVEALVGVLSMVFLIYNYTNSR